MKSFNQRHQLVASDGELGQRVKRSAFTDCHRCETGDAVMVGAFIEIQQKARVGAGCELSIQTLNCEVVSAADRILIGRDDTIGECPTVGAGSVVTGDILADDVVASTLGQGFATLTVRSF